jgi:hypothetical protein
MNMATLKQLQNIEDYLDEVIKTLEWYAKSGNYEQKDIHMSNGRLYSSEAHLDGG